MKDTVAVACPVERDATWGSRWSPQDVGWLVVPRDVGWLPWWDALARQHPHIHLRIPAGTLIPCVPILGGSMHAVPSKSVRWRCHPSHLPPWFTRRQSSDKLLRKRERALDRKTPLPTQRDVFVQRGSTSCAHRFSPTLCSRCMETIHHILHKSPRGASYTNTSHLQIHPSFRRASSL